MILVADTRSSASLSQDNARGQNRFSLSLSLSNLRFYIYIFNVIVVNRSPSDPKRADISYNRIVFIWDPWMLRSSEEDREGELGEFVVTRKKNASFRFLWREEGEVGVSGVY